MSLHLVTGLLFAGIVMNLRRVDTAEAAVSQSLDCTSHIGKQIEMANCLQKGIYPGTKWCGKGDVAQHDTDYGIHRNTDKCCRIHDACETYIEAGATKYCLTNRGNLTVMSCECDQVLMTCLINVTTAESVPESDKQAAKEFGVISFNVNGQKCLEKLYPLVCVEKGHHTDSKYVTQVFSLGNGFVDYHTLKQGLEGRCNKCMSDTNKTKVWNLVNNPQFSLE